MPVVSGFILKQIKEYEDLYGYKLTGIKMALYWFHVVEGNPIDTGDSKYNTQGIGIVPYIYDKARQFFTEKYRINKKNAEIQFDNTVEVIRASPPKLRARKNIDISKL